MLRVHLAEERPRRRVQAERRPKRELARGGPAPPPTHAQTKPIRESPASVSYRYREMLGKNRVTDDRPIKSLRISQNSYEPVKIVFDARTE